MSQAAGNTGPRPGPGTDPESGPGPGPSPDGRAGQQGPASGDDDDVIDAEFTPSE